MAKQPYPNAIQYKSDARRIESELLSGSLSLMDVFEQILFDLNQLTVSEIRISSFLSEFSNPVLPRFISELVYKLQVAVYFRPSSFLLSDVHSFRFYLEMLRKDSIEQQLQQLNSLVPYYNLNIAFASPRVRESERAAMAELYLDWEREVKTNTDNGKPLYFDNFWDRMHNQPDDVLVRNLTPLMQALMKAPSHSVQFAKILKEIRTHRKAIWDQLQNSIDAVFVSSPEMYPLVTDTSLDLIESSLSDVLSQSAKGLVSSSMFPADKMINGLAFTLWENRKDCVLVDPVHLEKKLETIFAILEKIQDNMSKPGLATLKNSVKPIGDC